MAVNDAGQVAGYSFLAGNTTIHAFRYDPTPGGGGIMRDLGTLGGDNSYGNAINDAGQVAGDSFIPGGGLRAFRYDGTPGAGGVMRNLGTVSGGTRSDGDGINAAGQVAGTNERGSFGTIKRAFRYDGTPGAGGVMRELGTLGGAVSYGFGINAAGPRWCRRRRTSCRRRRCRAAARRTRGPARTRRRSRPASRSLQAYPPWPRGSSPPWEETTEW